MKNKIVIEEHVEPPGLVELPANAGEDVVTDTVYFKDVEVRLQEYKLRLEDMDATGIETAILSLTLPVKSFL